MLIQDGRADPRVDHSFPLRAAAILRQHGVLQLLLKDGRADPATLSGSSLLNYAGTPAYETVMRLLLADGRLESWLVSLRVEPMPRVLLAALCWRRRRPWMRALAACL